MVRLFNRRPAAKLAGLAALWFATVAMLATVAAAGSGHAGGEAKELTRIDEYRLSSGDPDQG
jgi:hypothetical protein